jgi:hypothetical protein
VVVLHYQRFSGHDDTDDDVALPVGHRQLWQVGVGDDRYGADAVHHLQGTKAL